MLYVSGTNAASSLKSEDMWTPYKELQRIVESAVSHPDDDRSRGLEEALRNHKQNFITLFANPVSRTMLRFSFLLPLSLPIL